MTPTPGVRLDDPGLEWTTTTIPDSGPPIALVRLHVGPTGAVVSLVRFPPGWMRPGTGHYTCAEEFVVLEGWIALGGVRTPAGHFAYLPPRVERTDTRVAEAGCLAVAWFSGPPRWTAGAPQRAAPERPRGGPVAALHRDAAAEVPGRARAREGLDPAATAVDRDVLAPAERAWVFVPAGAPAPALRGLVVVREWR